MNYISCFKTLKYRNTLLVYFHRLFTFSSCVSFNLPSLSQIHDGLHVLPQRQRAGGAVPAGPARLRSGLPSGGLHQDHGPLHPRRQGEGVPGALGVQRQRFVADDKINKGPERMTCFAKAAKTFQTYINNIYILFIPQYLVSVYQGFGILAPC